MIADANNFGVSFPLDLDVKVSEGLFIIHETYPKGEEILTSSLTIAGESYTLGGGFPH